MGEWKEYQLDELASVTGGKRLPMGALLTDMPTSHPYIRTRDLAGNKVDANALQFVPDDVFPHIKQYIVTAGDIIVSVVGTIGLCAMIPEELHNASLTENCNRISGFKTSLVSPEYLFFYLTGSVGQDELRQRTVGSTQPKLPMYNLREMPILLPPVEEQRAIASVLSSLDAKIDLLHRQNKTLEAMAETLFRQWFVLKQDVEGDASTWEESTIGSVTTVLEAGRRPAGGVTGILSGVPSIGAESIVGLGHFDYAKTKYVPREYYNSMQRGKVQDMDVLIYKDGGRPGEFEPHVTLVGHGFPFDECCINEHVFRIRTEPDLPQSFLYFWLTSEAIMDEMRNNGTGAAIPGINFSGVRELTVVKPPAHVLKRFTDVVDPMITRILANCKESRTLATLRDTLLPKLMSGEVRVEEMQAQHKQRHESS